MPTASFRAQNRAAIVRAFREERGWTQAEAAEWYGCTERSWRRYESCDRPVPLPLLRRVMSRTRRKIA